MVPNRLFKDEYSEDDYAKGGPNVQAEEMYVVVLPRRWVCAIGLLFYACRGVHARVGVACPRKVEGRWDELGA